MKRYQIMLAGTGAIVFASLVATPVYAQGQNRFGTNGNTRNGAATVSTKAYTTTLNADEQSTLIYMLEEEKLAHDVYVALYEKWGLSIFNNISKSEQKHQSSVAAAVSYYGLTDNRSNTVGTFTNPDLQKLYNDLIAKGLTSQTAALEVGKTIEEVDIADLKKAMSATNSTYLDSVYARLLKGSENHLKAFNRQLN